LGFIFTPPYLSIALFFIGEFPVNFYFFVLHKYITPPFFIISFLIENNFTTIIILYCQKEKINIDKTWREVIKRKFLIMKEILFKVLDITNDRNVITKLLLINTIIEHIKNL